MQRYHESSPRAQHLAEDRREQYVPMLGMRMNQAWLLSDQFSQRSGAEGELVALENREMRIGYPIRRQSETTQPAPGVCSCEFPCVAGNSSSDRIGIRRQHDDPRRSHPIPHTRWNMT